jgi:hypothetical protein
LVLRLLQATDLARHLLLEASGVPLLVDSGPYPLQADSARPLSQVSEVPPLVDLELQPQLADLARPLPQVSEVPLLVDLVLQPQLAALARHPLASVRLLLGTVLPRHLPLQV